MDAQKNIKFWAIVYGGIPFSDAATFDDDTLNEAFEAWKLLNPEPKR